MLICLANGTKYLSSSNLASKIGVSPRYLMMIGSKLHEAGILQVTYGHCGGYRLARSPSDISLLEVIEVMEGLPQRRISELDIFRQLEISYDRIKTLLSAELCMVTLETLIR